MDKNFELSTDTILASWKLVELENDFLRKEIDALEAQLASLNASLNGQSKGQKSAKQTAKKS